MENPLGRGPMRNVCVSARLLYVDALFIRDPPEHTFMPVHQVVVVKWSWPWVAAPAVAPVVVVKWLWPMVKESFLRNSFLYLKTKSFRWAAAAAARWPTCPGTRPPLGSPLGAHSASSAYPHERTNAMAMAVGHGPWAIAVVIAVAVIVGPYAWPTRGN